MSLSSKSIARKIRNELSRVSRLENYTLPELVSVYEDDFDEAEVKPNTFYIILSRDQSYKERM